MMTATQSKSNLERGTDHLGGTAICLQNLLDDFRHRQALDFKFGAQNEAVFEHGQGHGLDVVGRDKIASGNGGISAGVAMMS